MGSPSATDPINDIPLSLKATLVDDDGLRYREFRRSLEPRWSRVWFELGAAYGVLAGVIVALVLTRPTWPWTIPAGLAGALVIGYTIHFINCSLP